MPPVIEVRNLHKRYGNNVAVDDVSLTVQEGEILGILGPNGAGKTTTVECVEGLRAPDRGEIKVFGLDPLRDRAEVTPRSSNSWRPGTPTVRRPPGCSSPRPRSRATC
ncbi:ATP-binding cassette domain-containing protein [Nonomuraea terrae]|uniref:ATP-binding cassette domain-containing protein n=1 Tax=Nonomuraea terrae TaxID=2530383 RepID=A0A4R4ZH19_9ACTN|nr:ATP-binding cassette domain-containing protein [Nonomuraea terrae]